MESFWVGLRKYQTIKGKREKENMKKKLDEKRTNFHFSSLSHVYLEFSTLCQGNSLRSIDNKTVKSFPKKEILNGNIYD